MADNIESLIAERTALQEDPKASKAALKAVNKKIADLYASDFEASAAPGATSEQRTGYVSSTAGGETGEMNLGAASVSIPLTPSEVIAPDVAVGDLAPADLAGPSEFDGPVLTEADAQADLDGTERPDNPSPKGEAEEVTRAASKAK